MECRKDRDAIDETPGAYKAIEAVMAAQRDLVEVVAVLKALDPAIEHAPSRRKDA